MVMQHGPTSDSKLPFFLAKQTQNQNHSPDKLPKLTTVVIFNANFDWYNSLVQYGLCIPGPSHWQCVLRLAQQLSGSPRVLLSDAEFHRRSFYVRFNAETISSSAEDNFHLPM